MRVVANENIIEKTSKSCSVPDAKVLHDCGSQLWSWDPLGPSPQLQGGRKMAKNNLK